jgi:ribosomal protein S2
MFLKTNDHSNIHLGKLVSENCLLLGQKQPSSTKNSTKNFFVLGRRNNVEVLKKNKMRFLISRLYPLISSFYRTSLDVDDVKILFATTTKSYRKVIKEAALRSNMPFYVDRWLCGSITATLQSTQFALNQAFHPEKNREEKYYDFFYEKKFKRGINIEKTEHHKKNRWSTLAVIPDVANNPMILREIDRVSIPTTGLVNEELVNFVTYPMFANDNSLYTISFFCNLISKIAAREKSLFSSKKKYILNLGKKNLKKNKIKIGKLKPYLILRRKKKNYKGFWKFLKTYIFPGKNTPKFIKKISKKKLRTRQYYINALKRKNKFGILKTPVRVFKKENMVQPFYHFTKKDFISSLLVSKKKTNYRRLYRSYILLKSWQSSPRTYKKNNSWIISDKTKVRFLPISKKLFLKLKKNNNKKFKLAKKKFIKERKVIFRVRKVLKRLRIKNKRLLKHLNKYLKKRNPVSLKLYKNLGVFFKRIDYNKNKFAYFTSLNIFFSKTKAKKYKKGKLKKNLKQKKSLRLKKFK